MAKHKVRPEKGALSRLLKEKAITQMDAHDQTRVDRKTLLKIDRGEEVKRETLEKVATKLRIPVDRFLGTSGAEIRDDDIHDRDDGFGRSVTLSKITPERLRGILITTSRIHWEINAQLGGDTHTLLEEFEQAVESLRKNVQEEDDDGSLRFQLWRLKTVEDINSSLKQLAERRLTILVAEYLFWKCDNPPGDFFWNLGNTTAHYTSSQIVLFSVEPRDTQSRRVRVAQGSLPPKFAPDGSRILVNGLRLKTKEEYDAIGAAEEKADAANN
jgi:hypothetical protein